VEAAQDGDGPHGGARRRARCAILRANGEPLRQALMWPRLVEVVRILPQHAPQVPLAQDQHMVEAFTPHTPEEPLATAFCLGAR